MRVNGSCHCGQITYEPRWIQSEYGSATAQTVKFSLGPRFASPWLQRRRPFAS
jgi:hypothetical protein